MYTEYRIDGRTARLGAFYPAAVSNSFVIALVLRATEGRCSIPHRVITPRRKIDEWIGARPRSAFPLLRATAEMILEDNGVDLDADQAQGPEQELMGRALAHLLHEAGFGRLNLYRVRRAA